MPGTVKEQTITEEELHKALDTLSVLAKAGMSDEELEKALGINGEDLSKSGACGDTLKKSDDGDEDDEKEEHDEPDEDNNGGESDGDEDDEDEKDDMNKSFSPDFDQSDSVQSAVEVSEFLADLVKGIQDGMAEIGKEMSRIRRYQQATAEALNKSLSAVSGELKNAKAEIEDLKKSQTAGIEDLIKSLADGGATQPAHARKAARVNVMEKSFAQDAGGQEQSRPLTRTQVSDKLMDLSKSGHVSDNEVLAFESMGIGALKPDTLKLLGL